MASQTIQPAHRFRQRSARAADPLQKAILVESEVRERTAPSRWSFHQSKIMPIWPRLERNLHQTGNEVTWWEKTRIEPLPIARKLWEVSHPRAAAKSATQGPTAPEAQTVAASETKPLAPVRS